MKISVLFAIDPIHKNQTVASVAMATVPLVIIGYYVQGLHLRIGHCTVS